MPRFQTVSLIIFAAFLVVGTCLCVGGCIGAKNAYPLFLVLPAALGFVCLHGFLTSEESGAEGGLVSGSSWMFMLVSCLVSIIALPLVLGHVGTLSKTGTWLTTVGAVIIIAGFAALNIFNRSNDIERF